MQRLCTKLRCLALQSTQTLPSISASPRLLHHYSPPPIHSIPSKWSYKSVINYRAASIPLALNSFPHSPLRFSLVQVRHVSSRERAKRRKPMTPRTSKIKKIKIKSYSSYKSRFGTMGDGNIRSARQRPFTFFLLYAEMTGSALNAAASIRNKLCNHRPLPLSEDDYTRVCLIPKRKGANFRDLPGVIVGKDNVVRRDPMQEKRLLPSEKPLVPDYCFTFEQGKSKRPFARLWWDETVPTVVTYPHCHSQAALHPEQDRVLTIREYARLQGFPDYYRFCGTLKERYCQIGNAVAVPLSRALGYATAWRIKNGVAMKMSH